MHEYSLARSLIRQVQQLLTEHTCDHVLRVHVSIGEFSGVEPELLSSAYEQLIEGTPLAKSKLVLERVPLEARCEGCGSLFLIDRFQFVCPECHDRRLTIVRGEEMILESLTLETVAA